MFHTGVLWDRTLIVSIYLKIIEYFVLKVCRRWQSLVHVCFRKKACREINKEDLNEWLLKNRIIPSEKSIAKVLLLCGESMTELSMAGEGKLLRIIGKLFVISQPPQCCNWGKQNSFSYNLFIFMFFLYF